MTFEDGGGGSLVWVLQYNKPLNPATSTGDYTEFYLDGVQVYYVSAVVDGLDATKLRLTTSWEVDPFDEGEIYYNATNHTIQSLDGDWSPTVNLTRPSPF